MHYKCNILDGAFHEERVYVLNCNKFAINFSSRTLLKSYLSSLLKPCYYIINAKIPTLIKLLMFIKKLYRRFHKLLKGA